MSAAELETEVLAPNIRRHRRVPFGSVHAPHFVPDAKPAPGGLSEDERRLAELDHAIATAEAVKSLPHLRRERETVAAAIEAKRQAEAEEAERLVRFYEEARAAYAEAQDRLLEAIPIVTALLNECQDAKLHQAEALRAAEAAEGGDLPENVLPLSHQAARFIEPARTAYGLFKNAVRQDV